MMKKTISGWTSNKDQCYRGTEYKVKITLETSVELKITLETSEELKILLETSMELKITLETSEEDVKQGISIFCDQSQRSGERWRKANCKRLDSTQWGMFCINRSFRLDLGVVLYLLHSFRVCFRTQPY
jgi:hypothetical protein